MPPEDRSNLVGTHLNERYHIDAVLGQGSMGEVYRARDTTLKRDVAVKVLSHQSLGTSGRTRLLHEAQFIAKLNHPNIVSVHDAGDQDGLPFIVMEFVEGHTLHEARPEDLDTILSIAVDICGALEHAHAQGIIHRDIKPENVVLDGSGRAKLMDFGIALSPASRLTEAGTLLGTVFYISPEQALGKPVDQRADLYSLGVLLYELVCGRLPFEADDPLAVITQHLHAPLVPPRAVKDDIPAGLNDLIVCLLEKDPRERPGTAAEVLERLGSISIKPVSDIAAIPSHKQDHVSMLERITSGRMVGRRAELEKARAVWQDAAAGQGQLLLISGEPGIGKTRLVQELITQTNITGGKALTGRSYAEWEPPYAPFRQILREAIRDSNGSGFKPPEEMLIDLVRIAPELRADFPNLPERKPEDPQAEQQRLLDQIILFFNLLCNHTPLLLVLEDAHWSDSSTLVLLRHLARNTRTQRLMILVTYREVELDEARSLHEILLDFNREKLGLRIKLNRLNRQETRDMLAVLFAEEITPEFLDGIYRETEGNPFFIEEVCKALVESGKLTYQDGRWKKPSMEEIGVPQSIQVAIQSRLRTLPEASRGVLEQAAILGREFDFETLLSVLNIDEDSLLDALDDALYARLLEETDHGKGEGFAFVHALIPATIAAGLRTLQRRRLHKRAAHALEKLHPDSYEALAYHHIEAGETDKGVNFLIQAGDRARGLFAHQEAINSYQQALDHLKEEGEMVQAARTLMKLGLTYHNDFRFPESRRAYEEAFDLWQQAGKLQEDELLPPAPHAFRVFMPEPVSIDPSLNRDGWSLHITTNLFSGLVELNSNSEIVPEVAQRWEVLDNGRRYLFHLRDDVTWSDGVPVRAYDFEYAWKRVLVKAKNTNEEPFHVIKNARAYVQGDLRELDAVGIYTRDALILEVELERPYNAFLNLVSGERSLPVPRHILQEHGDSWTDLDVLVTNGPFRLESWDPGKSLTLGANPTYKGYFPGNLEQVEILFYPGTRFEFPDVVHMGQNLYQDDRIDILYAYRARELRDFAISQYPAEFRTAPFLMTLHIGFNTTQPPFDDRRIRRAFALATDREYLANTVFGSMVFPATGGYLPPGMPGYSEGIAVPFDTMQAKKLLAEAGYPGGRGFPVIETMFSGSILESLRDHWKKNLGVELIQSNITWEQFDEIESHGQHKNVHIWGRGFIGSTDPYSYLLSTTGFGTGWQNDEYTELLKNASEMMDFAECLKLYQRADQILIDEVPILPFGYSRFNLLVKPWVRRFPLSPTRGWFWKEVILEAH